MTEYKTRDRKLAGRSFFMYPPFSGRDFLKAPRRSLYMLLVQACPLCQQQRRQLCPDPLSEWQLTGWVSDCPLSMFVTRYPIPCSAGLALGRTKEEGFEKRGAVSTPICPIVTLSSWGLLHSLAQVPSPVSRPPTFQSFVFIPVSHSGSVALFSSYSQGQNSVV